MIGLYQKEMFESEFTRLKNFQNLALITIQIIPKELSSHEHHLNQTKSEKFEIKSLHFRQLISIVVFLHQVLFIDRMIRKCMFCIVPF